MFGRALSGRRKQYRGEQTCTCAILVAANAHDGPHKHHLSPNMKNVFTAEKLFHCCCHVHHQTHGPLAFSADFNKTINKREEVYV